MDVTISDGQILESPACRRAHRWFDRLNVEPVCKIDSEKSDFSEAISNAVELLEQSRSPIVCGLDGLSTQSQILAFEIAKQVRAQVDTTVTSKYRSSVLAMQNVGNVTASLGEVSTRSDLIVFWYCDPVTTHPRFIDRYCKTAGKIIVVSEAGNATSERADQFIQIRREEMGQFIARTRLCTEGKSETTHESAEFANSLMGAKYGAFVIGSLDLNPTINENTQSLVELVQTLNQRTRFVSIALRDDANAQSAENVLTWSTGYPFAVNLLGEHPQFNGVEFSAEKVLAGGACDVALICSAYSLNSLSRPAQENLSRISQIVITDEPGSLDIQPKVQFNVNFDEGDWCRMDDVSLPVVNFLQTGGAKQRTARAVLTAIRARLV